MTLTALLPAVAAAHSDVLLLALLTVASATFGAAIVLQWKAITHWNKVVPVTLLSGEGTRQRTLGKYEIEHTAILTLVFAIFFVQFVGIVYAATFTLDSSTSEAEDTVDIAMFDVDADGDLDYIAANNDTTNTYKLALYTNSGTGSFSTAVKFGTSTGLKRIKAGDVDGDGDIDFVTLNVVSGTITIYIYFNNGSGTFSSSTISPNGSNGSDLQLMDVNTDGDLDIVYISSTSSVTDGVWHNNGRGTFTASASTLTSGVAMANADLTGDGNLDLAIAIGAVGTVFDIYANTGTGSFVDIDEDNFGTQHAIRSIIPFDSEGDGDIDLAVTKQGGSVQILTNNGAGTFITQTSFGSQTDARNAGFADIDSDGDYDVVVAGADTNSAEGGGTVLYTSNGSNSWTLTATHTERNDYVTSVALGDIDSDGDLDFVRANQAINGTSGQVNRHYKNDQAASNTNAAPGAPSTLTASGTVNASATGTRSVSSGPTNVNSTGSVAWTSPSSAATSNDSYATATLNAGEWTNWLLANDFGGWGIPSNAKIVGIKVEIEKSPTITGYLCDRAVRIVKASQIKTADRGNTNCNGATTSDEDYISYGGIGDLWGETWTPSDFVVSGFGVAYSAQATASGVQSKIDHIRITVYYATTISLRLSWGSGSDDTTPLRLLQYQVRVGSGSSGTNNILSGKTSSPQYVTRILPNNQSRTVRLTNIGCGFTYYWAVRTRDLGLRLGGESCEQTTTVSNSCTVSTTSCSGSGSSGNSDGGGTLWTGARTVPSGHYGRLRQGKIEGGLFGDWNGNGKKDLGERGILGGISVTIRGKDAAGNSVSQKKIVKPSGKFEFEVPASNDDGYTIDVDETNALLDGWKATAGSPSTTVKVEHDKTVRLDIGWHYREQAGNAPCLQVRDGTTVGQSAGEQFVSILEDIYGKKVLRDVDLQAPLITRENYLRLLLRVGCVQLAPDRSSVQKLMLASGKSSSIVAFSDVPLDVQLSEKSSEVYTALAIGIPIGRTDTKQKKTVFAGTAFITRNEALTWAWALLQSKSKAQNTTLDIDVVLKGLKSRWVVEKSLQNGLIGVTKKEVLTMLSRIAFALGNVNLTSDPKHAAAIKPLVLPELALPSQEPCWVRDSTRASGLKFSDVSIGSQLWKDIQKVGAIGIVREEEKILWALSGSPQLTEYGVLSTTGYFEPNSAVTVPEIIRSMLILSCMPPESATDVKDKLVGILSAIKNGSANNRAVRDNLLGTQRNTTLLSRLMYRAEDRQTRFNLGLLTFADSVMSGKPRPVNAPVTVREGAELLASLALYMQVDNQVLPRETARGMVGNMQLLMLRLLTGKQKIDWRSGEIGKNEALTKQQLMRVLAEIVTTRYSKEDRSEDPSVGEIWHEAVVLPKRLRQTTIEK